ncbi:MAG: SprT-like domain-containing protein [Patescibacteria group bacterium]|nr:SprT-like domain-containing protein [Patescibacteria group bacterium]
MSIKMEVISTMYVSSTFYPKNMITETVTYINNSGIEKLYNILKNHIFSPLNLYVPDSRNIYFIVKNYSKGRRLASFSYKTEWYKQKRDTFGGKKIKISFNFNKYKSWDNVVAIMAHEMIHAHQYSIGRGLSHDKYFYIIGNIVKSKLKEVFPDGNFDIGLERSTMDI